MYYKVSLCLLALSLFLAARDVSALTMTSDAPGNIFAAGSPIQFTVKEAQGDVGYELADYFGAKVASGTAPAATIDLAGLKPGWYQLTCRDAASEATASVGVLIDRGKAPLPVDGRICTDVAGAWLVKSDSYKAVARMVRLAGIPWVRERLHWIGQREGDIDWGRYQSVADAYAAEGIHVYQIWHDSPEWSHPDRKGNVCPDDLRDVYNFARKAASHFSGQIQAWEVWNEPDIGFWPDLSDRYSGLLKAGYLGIKDGNPKAMVLQGSLCRGVTRFAKSLYACGSAGYFDIFNWHIYAKPAVYPGALASHLELLRDYGAADRPVWLSEAGIRVDGTEGPKKRELNASNQHAQCQFIPRLAAMSLAAGTDRTFFFVLPDYVEGVTQWGALHPDLTPYPSFVALSAATNIIGQSTYKGEYKAGGAAVAQLFATPKGNVLVAWSDTESEISVPTDRQTVRVANIFGDERSVAAKNGAVRVKVGPDAVYLLDIGKTIEKSATGSPRPLGKLPRLKPSRVVVVGHAELPALKEADACKITEQTAFDYPVEVYNFSDKDSVEGSIEVTAPDGWKVYNPKREVSLEPMGRQVIAFRVRPGAPSAGSFKLTVRGEFGGEQVAPCVSLFSYDLAVIEPVRRERLDLMGTDPNGHFDPDAISAVKIGCNAGRGYLVFETSGFKLVRFGSR